MELDPLLLSRLQFAFTVSFHILFPAFTIGLASYLAMLEGLWLATGRQTFRDLYDFWIKIFAVSFGMGVVSGIVMSYQFGTNWSEFSQATGNILGPLLSYEVVTAFFLEAAFLGIMLFGQDRVSRGLHFFATLMVAVGTLLSTFWIIAANSWLQTPGGFEVRDGVFYVTSWWDVIFTESFPYRLVHMVFGAYLTTAFAVLGVAAWMLLRQRAVEHARVMMKMALPFIAIMAPLQIVAGDLSGLNVVETQPAKLAAMEGHWETGSGIPLLLFAIPDAEAETNRFEVGIPKLGSLILTHDWDGEVTGLKEFEPEDRPPVGIVFWSFRIMVGIGLLMLFVGFYGIWRWWRGKLLDRGWFLRLCMIMGPSGLVAVVSGWITAEVGRQPYVVYGLIRTADAVSPLPWFGVAASLTLFVLVYGIVFSAGTYFILKLIRKGPEQVPPSEVPKRPKRPLSAAHERLSPAE